jgi:hypothetical protein
MNYYALFPSITAVLIALMGFFVLYKNRRNILSITYSFLSFALFLWLMDFSLMYWFAGYYNIAYIFAKIGFVGVILTPVCALHFILEFLNSPYKKYIPYIYISTIPVIIINFTSHLIYRGLSNNFWGYYPIAGILYFIPLIQFTLTFSTCAYMLFGNLNNPKFSAIKQQQTKYLAVAFSIAVFGAGDYITKYDFVEIYPFGYILMLIFIVIITWSIIKTNLMDIKLVLTQTGIIVVLYTLVLGIPFYIGLGTGEWFLASLMLFALSTIGPMVLKYLQRKAERILLAEQNAYQQLLVQASKGMIEQQQLPKLAQLTVRIIKRSVKVNFVYLFILDHEKNKYVCLGARGEVNKNLDINFSEDSKICEYMKSVKDPFLFFNLRKSLKDSFSNIAKDINLIVPSMLRDKLIAFLVLGEKTNKTVYSSQDIEVFKTLSNQAGLAIENCNFLAETQKQQKRLYDAEKLASIGGMADGMAHQIKNRLNVFLMGHTNIDFEIKDFEEANKELIDTKPQIKNIL